MELDPRRDTTQQLIPDTNEKEAFLLTDDTIMKTRRNAWHYEGNRVEQHAGQHVTTVRQSRVDAYFVEAAAGSTDDCETTVRQRLLSDLLEIEAVLKTRKKAPILLEDDLPISPRHADTNMERRQHRRVIYPLDHCPNFSFADQSTSVLDLSHAGMRLMADAGIERLNIVRGVIDFTDQPSMPVIGKVVWKNELCIGLRLLTRVGHRTLENERHRLDM